MPKQILHIDYESRSAADLRKVGADVYAADPSTEIVCAAYAFDDGPVHLWRPLEGELAPAELVTHIKRGGEVEAWNATFEMLITNGPGVRDWGMPQLHPEQVTCTMVKAYAMGLPGSLEGGAAALGIAEQKDAAGGRIMLQLSKPKTTNPLTWWDDAERLERLYAYCRQDVVVERMASARMPRLSPYERRVWEMDYRINRRGVKADIPVVTKALELVEKEKERLNAEIQAISNGAIATCTAVAQIKNYLELFGVTGDALDKAAVKEHLATDLPPQARRILELRAEAGKAATSKFSPMLTRSSGEDSRIRGGYQYSGANTRRWAARGLQLHNMQRPTIKFSTIESIIADVGGGMSAEELALYYGPPMDFLGSCTRSFLMADKDKEFLVADFSAIEARVAGQEDALAAFRDGRDIYKTAAAQIFGVKYEGVTDDQRQVGKVSVLSLGYGGGISAFQTMARGYGVRMEPAFGHLLHQATPEQRIRAEETYKNYTAKVRDRPDDFDEISREEFLASELTKIFWRAANPNIVNYWYELENSAITAVGNPGRVYAAKSIRFKKAGSFLWCQLPGGGVICYPYAEINTVKTPWGAEKHALTYMAEDGVSRKWTRFTTYGGSIFENVDQAVSRDLLADAMLRLEAKGYSIVLHTHDEACCEEPIGEHTLDEMIAIMTENPAWAATLPMKAAGFVSRRYRK
jgi:DNA polymerase